MYFFGLGNFTPIEFWFSEKATQAGDRTGVSSQTKYDQKYNDTGVRITVTHIQDQLDFLRSMLIGMAVRGRSIAFVVFFIPFCNASL